MRNKSTFYKVLQYFFHRLANQGGNQCQQLQVHIPAVTSGLTVTDFLFRNTNTRPPFRPVSLEPHDIPKSEICHALHHPLTL
ncbi:hypothetical protein BJP43_10465 (plasmid) [Candidatus Williamhamiltonella defendens]|uniref:Uncharacterized protein n=1 Tax=Candidatus Williamhamiltonella defendens TaxID=138072 RepID=A0A2D3TG97_9ENTR|nr:hypothetical protein BJP43_10465 [Candidatus Hamiltonella defensa]